MSTHNHFDDDNDNTNDERGAAAQGPDGANVQGKADGPDGTGHAADADGDIEAEVEVDEFVDVDDRPIDHEVTSEDAPNLARLLRQAGRSLRREFLSAVADEDIDPRDVADLRRRGRRYRHDEDVADGGVWAESDHRDDADGVDPDELRDRVRALRDRVSAKVEDILTADEVAAMSESLTKIIDALGGDDDDIRRCARRCADSPAVADSVLVGALMAVVDMATTGALAKDITAISPATTQALPAHVTTVARMTTVTGVEAMASGLRRLRR